MADDWRMMAAAAHTGRSSTARTAGGSVNQSQKTAVD